MTKLALFCRPPTPGTTKTRLIPALGAERAAALYRAFLEDTLSACARVPDLDVELWCAGNPDDPGLVDVAPGLVRVSQPEGDLGVRMAAALDATAAHPGIAMVVGSDSPTLPSAHVALAVQALTRASVVLGPSADGGYYLVGARDGVGALFETVRWSTRHALADTQANALRAGLSVATVPPWYDVDVPEDLRLLQTHLRLAPSAAPATARLLGL